jgi:hypothetical protein
MHVRTTATDLARWVEDRGGMWTVDGEPQIVGRLPVPAGATAIAEALAKRGGDLAVLLPDGSDLEDGALVTAADLARAAHLVDAHHVFQLAWIDAGGAVKDSWLLAEHDALAQSGETGAAAAKVVASWREGWRAPSPRIFRKPQG